MKRLTSILTLVLIVTALSSCNDTDDVVKIFTKDIKKMTMLLEATETNPREQDLWDGNAKAKEESVRLRDEPGNYEITFDYEEEPENGRIHGTFKGRAVKTILKGKWSANGKNQEMSMMLNADITPASETDRLAKEFIRALQGNSNFRIYKYQGDDQSLSVFYDKENKNVKKFIGFITLKD